MIITLYVSLQFHNCLAILGRKYNGTQKSGKFLYDLSAIPIMVGAGRRGITLGKTDDLVSAPSRPYTVAWQGESGGSEIVVNRQDRGRRSRPYAIVSIIGIAGTQHRRLPDSVSCGSRDRPAAGRPALAGRSARAAG